MITVAESRGPSHRVEKILGEFWRELAKPDGKALTLKTLYAIGNRQSPQYKR